MSRVFAPVVMGGSKSPLAGVGATYSYPGYSKTICETTLATLHKTCASFHNWGAQCYPYQGILEFEPTIYSPGCNGQELSGDSPYLLTYNEPRGMPEEYVDPWLECVELYSDRHVFLPSFHHGQFGWIDNFHEELARRGRAEEAYGLSFHVYPDWYPGAAGAMIANLENAKERADAWGLDMWLTEFAMDPGGPNGIEDSFVVMDAVWDWCVRNRKRCFWFQHSFRGDEPWWSRANTSLVDYYTGELTELGRHWVEMI